MASASYRLEGDPNAETKVDDQLAATRLTEPAAPAGVVPFSTADLRAIMWRQRWMMIGSIASAAVLGLLITFLITPRYEAISTMRIEATTASITDAPELQPTVDWHMLSRYMSTLSQMLQSRSMAEQVLDGTGLAANEKALEALGVASEGDGADKAVEAKVLREDLIKYLREHVEMTVPIDNNIAAINFESTDPVVAAELANAYADALIRTNLLQQSDSNTYARQVLGEQVIQTRQKLAQAEREVLDYASANRLITTADPNADASSPQSASGGGNTITSADLVGTNVAFTEARNARIMAEQRWRAAQRTNPLSLPEAREDPAIQNMRIERTKAEAALAEALGKYLPEHPIVQEARAEVAAMDGQLKRAGDNLVRSIRNEYEVARQQERQLDQARNSLASSTLEEQEKRVQLGILSRDAQALRDQLANLLTRLNQVDAASDTATNNISIVDRAIVPDKPSAPSIPKNLLLALAIGLVVGGMFSLLREIFDDTLYSPEDVERKLGYNLLGVTPKVDGAAGDTTDSKSMLSEAYFSLRGAIDAATGGRRAKTILITSSRPGEGKSTSSSALARDFGATGRRTLLIDGDLRNPSVHRMLSLPNERGFSDVLLGDVQLDDVLIDIPGTKLSVLTSGHRPENPAQVLSDDLVTQFLSRNVSKFDVIIIDSPPVMGLVDAPALAALSDFAVLVVEAGRAHFGSAKTALRRLRLAHARVAGIILTKFDQRQSGYGYGYGYEYYKYDADQAA